MKVTVDRAAFADAVAWVTRAIASRPVAPVMSSIRLTAEGDTLTILGSNFDVTHKAKVPCQVNEDGQVLVLGALTKDLANALRGESLELIHDEDKAGVVMRAGRSTYRLSTVPLEEWPSLPEFPPTVGTVDGAAFRGLVKTVKHFADDNASIEATKGLRIEADGGELRTVGTNAFVISTATCPIDDTASFGVQVPARHFDGALGGMTGEVTVAHDDSTFGISDATREVVFRTLQSEYANWRKGLTLTGDDFTVIADTADLSEAVKRATIACEREKPLWLSITPGALEVTAGRLGNPDGAEQLAVDTDGTLDVAFAPHFLTAVLSVIDTEQVALSFVNHQKRPVQVSSPGDDSSLHVVMPRDPARS